MRVLVTGAAGLYGFHVLQELVSQNTVAKVFGIDDFSRGFPGEEEFMAYPWGKKVQIIKQRFQDTTVKEINSLNVDVVMHLAGYNSGKESMNTPEEYFLNNEYGTFQLMQKLLRTRNKPFLIYASTIELHGVTGPTNIHAATKLAAEQHIMAAGKAYDYPVTALRFTNTYGENHNICGYTPVVASFIDRALRHEPLIIYGSGNQTRDFMYVKDGARALYLAAIRNKDIKGLVLNVATGVETSIKDLAAKIIRLAKSTSEIIKLPCEKEESRGTAIDVTPAREKLAWRPRFTLEEGLLKTINWHKGLTGI